MGAVTFDMLSLFVLFSSIFRISCWSSNSYHLWNGKLAYYNGAKEMDLNNTLTMCSHLGGRLPSVHSEDDRLFLVQLIGRQSRVWLGGTVEISSSREERDDLIPTKNSSIDPRARFRWYDDSPFDFQTWIEDEPNISSCRKGCCGIGLTTVVGAGFVVKECTSLRRMVCVINRNEQSSPSLHAIEVAITDTLNSSSRLDDEIEMIVGYDLEILNSSISALKERVKIDEFQLEQFNVTLSEMKSFFMKEINVLKHELDVLRRSEIDTQTDAKSEALKVEHDERSINKLFVVTDSVSNKVSLAFVTISFFIVTLLIAVAFVFYRRKSPSWFTRSPDSVLLNNMA